MSEFIDKSTGEEITPESITAKLKELGVPTEDSSEAETVTVEATKTEDTVVEIDDKTEERVYSDAEKTAIEKGWKPDGPKSAEEFLRAEPLYEEIKSRGKEIKELKSTLDELKAHMERQKEAGYRQALYDLQQARDAAILQGDVNAVNQIDAYAQQVHHEQFAPPPAPPGPADIPEVHDFLSRNEKWVRDPSYEAQTIREFAQYRDQQLAQTPLSPQERLQIIESDIKKQFSSYFDEGTVQRVSAPTVESNANSAPHTSAAKRKISFNDLSSEQKQCARHFEKRGVMSVDAYIKQLVEMGEL